MVLNENIVEITNNQNNSNSPTPEEFSASMKRKDNQYAMTVLLRREWLKKPPPIFLYNEDKNTFEIPFQTEEYKNWWEAGPSSLEEMNAIEKEQIELGTNLDDIFDTYLELDTLFTDSDEDEDFHSDSDSNPGFGDDKYVDSLASWIRPYLWELEDNNKEPPYLAFEEYRGSDNDMRLNITFKTDIFQEWWYKPTGHN